MKFSIFFLIISTFFLNLLVAQKENIIFDDLNWNSTTEDIRRIFGNDLILNEKDKYSNGSIEYFLNDYVFLNSNFKVYFIINNKTNKLNKILLKSKNTNSGTNKVVLNEQYDKTFRLILLKYGTPTFSKPSKLIDYYYLYNDTVIISISKTHSNWRNNMEKSVISKIPKLTITFQQRKPYFDFRQIMWACSKAKVLETEKLNPIVNITDTLKYKSTVLDINCIIEYFFQNDNLITARYNIKNLKSENEYIESYYKLKDWLENKYGNTFLDYDNFPYERDSLIGKESIHLSGKMYYSYWTQDDTSIEIMLTIENNRSELVVQYSCTNFTGICPFYKSRKLNE
ncbi:MAG: hypothetical protein GXO80_06120 [Chlorobi bacterium]|nr:hypothetical protein [Chlorobiota bacterium]